MKLHNMTSFAGIILVLTLILLLSAAQIPRETSTGDIPDLSQRINDFTLRFLKHVASGDTGNVIISPQSIYHGLAMSYVASGSDTRKELAHVVGFPDTDTQLMTDLSVLRKSMQSATPGAEVTMANSAWLDTTYAEFRKDYSDNLTRAFGASLYPVKFKDAKGTSDKINAWVSEKTKGRIPATVGPGDFPSRSGVGVIDEPALVTVNAVYFKVDWSSRFEESGTQEYPFHPDTNTTVNAMLMHQHSLLPYAENKAFKFLELPYLNGKYSMYVLLPKDTLPPGQMLSLIESNTVIELKRNASQQNVDVLFPKFEMKSHCRAKDVLMEMGISAAFSKNSADFDGMIIKKWEAYRIYLSQIYHDAWVAVDEKGTEAAAATTSVHYSLGCSAAMPELSVDFHADHPFMFFIVHNESRSVLFAGWVVNPLNTDSAAVSQ